MLVAHPPPQVMKAGDLVHVPSSVTLVADIKFEGLSYMSVFSTVVPKKAIFIRYQEPNKERSIIQYGEHCWAVETEKISLIEKDYHDSETIRDWNN